MIALDHVHIVLEIMSMMLDLVQPSTAELTFSAVE